MTNQLYQSGAFTSKIISDIDYTDASVVQFNIPVVENTFVDK